VFCILVASVFAMSGSGAIAESRALLVGVSGYPSLPEARRLKGPANDVQIMRNALLRVGFTPDNVTVLADGVPGSNALPTKRAILNAMRSLADRSRADDWAVVYFSGHGSQQPQLVTRDTRYIEPDGLDEIFLPYDIGQWDGSKRAVQGALIDDEIGVALDALSIKGVRVWAVFDTCHAGDMAKGLIAQDANGGPVTRYVSPSSLGVPRETIAQARVNPAAKRRPRERAKAGRIESVRPIIFYASQADEPAAEEPLPDLLAPQRGGDTPRSKRYFGLFTYLIAQALPTWQGNFGLLAQEVADRYKSRPYPTPMFEGDLALVPNFSVNLMPPTNISGGKP
jgi:hypothetical protein